VELKIVWQKPHPLAKNWKKMVQNGFFLGFLFVFLETFFVQEGVLKEPLRDES